MNEQPLDLRRLARAIWRGRLILLVAGLLGIAGGIGYTLVTPAVPTAIALVLLPGNTLTPDGTTAISPDTQVVIATSTPVLSTAGESVVPPIPADEVRRDVSVKAISPNVLQVEAKFARGAVAEALANSVATAYIDFVTAPTSGGGSVGVLQEQSSQLTQETQSLQKQIDTVSARLATENRDSLAFQQDSSLLGSLRYTQTQVSVEIDDLDNQILSSQQSSHLIAGSVRILQKASSLQPVSALRRPVLGAAGLAVGLIIGVVIALFRSRQDQKLRLRDEIASAINVPVLGSIRCASYRSPKAWRNLIRSYSPAPTDAWTLRSLLGGFDSPQTYSKQLRIVTFAEDIAALAAGPQVAILSAGTGAPTTLALSDDPALEALRSACALFNPDEDLAMPLRLVGPIDPWSVPSSGLTVQLCAVDADRPVLPPSNSANILAVSSGFATAESLARVALAAADVSEDLAGILVVNPESRDRSSGAVLRSTVGPADPTADRFLGGASPVGELQ